MYALLITAALTTMGRTQTFDIRPGFLLDKVPSTRPADWPDGVPWLEGMRPYRKARLSQRIVILNDQDNNRWQDIGQNDHFSNAPEAVNPNRLFPWRVAGGLDHCEGCSNRTFIYIPPGSRIQPETRYVDIPLAGRPLPRHLWWHPDGTVLADQLLNDRGECFEVRMREKRDGTWHNLRYAPVPEGAADYPVQIHAPPVVQEVLNLHGTVRAEHRFRHVPDLRGREFERTSLVLTYTDRGGLSPRNYTGPGLHCNTCHVHSGTTSYGISVRGGGDGDFSYNPYEDR